MDPKEIKGLMEAYQQIHAPQEEIEEAVKGEPSERRASLAAERRAGHRPLPAKEGEKYASYKMAQMDYAKRKRMEEEVEQVDEASYSAKAARAGKDIGKPGKAFAKIAKEAGKRYGSKERGEKVAGAVLAKLRKEDVDIFDVVLEFLQAEGYAETLEEAEKLMANVINDEAINIIVGEGYQRNPEKGEKEDRKYEPVRGEKTPMPPRGDKRREDFEKWYAANVR